MFFLLVGFLNYDPIWITPQNKTEMFFYVHPEKAKNAATQKDPTPERFYAFQRSMEAHATIEESKEQREKESMRRETRENILRTFRENRNLSWSDAPFARRRA